MNRPFTICISNIGSLAANIVYEFLMQVGATLFHISAVTSNDSDLTVMVGTAADTDAYMVAKTVGDSGTPSALDQDDFVNGQYPHIPAGTNVVITIDYDGSSGTAGDDLQLVATFLAD